MARAAAGRHIARAAATALLLAGVAACGGDAGGSGDGGPAATPTPSPTPPAIPVPEDVASRAADAGRWSKPLGFALQADTARQDPDYLRLWVEHATSVTPENALKWERVEPQQGRFDFTEADAIVDTAQRLGKRVRGHPLVWDNQLPPWVADRQWAAKDLAEVIRRHVTEIVTRYEGRVAVWDVVNEPLEDDGTLTPSVFTAALGERYLDIAFAAAHAADPDAKLFLNEIGADKPGPKQAAIIALAARLKQRGVPIDGLGLQNHAVVDDYPDRASLDATIDAVAAQGLDFEFTEMDVAMRYPGVLNPPTAQAQARAYRDAAAACAAHDACTGLTVWGVTDRHSWLGADKHPLPFDEAGDPKPAWLGLRAALGR